MNMRRHKAGGYRASTPTLYELYQLEEHYELWNSRTIRLLKQTLPPDIDQSDQERWTRS